jgi:hypothetical protein
MNYEILAIALGIWNITLQLRLNSKRKQTQRLMYSLDRIAQKKWKIITTDTGFDVIDHEGDRVLAILDKGKKHG